jgi:hypothetical protein
MNPPYLPEHLERFLHTLQIAAKEAVLLRITRDRLFSQPIDAAWLRALSPHSPQADTLEAFVSRFGRMQDTLGDKLLPRLALLEAEKPGSAIENYNRAERRGLIRSTENWLLMRSLRNKMVHEYQTDLNEFAQTLHLAQGLSEELLDCYRAVAQYARQHLQIPPRQLPSAEESE